MKNIFLAAVVLSGLAVAPAMAGEGGRDPFPNYAGDFTTHTSASALRYADTGSQAYPTQPGRPGSDLPSLVGEILPTNGSQGIVQTANSLPAHFEDGTVAYAQANQIRAWMQAHTQTAAPAYASASRASTPGG